MEILRSHATLRDIRVALMSGLPTEEKRQGALQKGACACIDKEDLVRSPTPFLKAVEECLRDISVVCE